jgi:regulator of replication initiation timing
MSEIVDKAKALMSTYEQLLEHTRNERDALRAELEKLRGELDEAEERADEAERACAVEWEKDCGQALRILAQVTKFEWDQDGSPADEVREHIQMTLESLEKQVVSLRAELAAAKDLLAKIHRDGGHHTEAVGFAQSVADADAKVSEWLMAEADRIAKEAANGQA